MTEVAINVRRSEVSARNASHVRRLWARAVRQDRQGQTERSITSWSRLAQLTGGAGVAPAASDIQPWRRLGPPTTPQMERRSRGSRDRSEIYFRGREYVMSQQDGERFLRSAGAQLIVDRPRARALVGEAAIDFRGKDLPFELLRAFIENQGFPVTDSELFQAAWERPLRTEYDRNALFFQVHVLRRMLGECGADLIGRCPAGYFLSRTLVCGIIGDVPVPRVSDYRQQVIAIARTHGFIDNRTLRQLTGASSSTSRRWLRSLVAEGLIVRAGAGRGVSYQLSAIAA